MYQQHSLQLIASLAKLDQAKSLREDEGRDNAITVAKMEVMQANSRLLPMGKPNYAETLNYPPIAKLIQDHDRFTIMKAVVLLINDLCDSINVVRNMNTSQVLEAASMMIDECADFRLEDYYIMFTLGKRGELVKIMDRVDINVITQIWEEYHKRRRQDFITKHEEAFTKYEHEVVNNPTTLTSSSGEAAGDQPGTYSFKDIVNWLKNFDREYEGIQSNMRKEEREAWENDRMEKVKDYTEKQGINLEEVIRQFGKSRLEYPEGYEPKKEEKK